MTVITRASKGSQLTWAEVDANFTTLRDVASQTSGAISGLSSLGVNGVVTLAGTGNSYATSGLKLGVAGIASGYIYTTDNLYIKPNTSSGGASGTVNFQNVSDSTTTSINTSNGQISTTASGGSAGLNLASTGTNYNYINAVNTGGGYFLGIERSTTGGLFTGTTAYATVFGTQGATVLQLATNGVVRSTLDASGNWANAGQVTAAGATAGNTGLMTKIRGNGSGYGLGIESDNNTVMIHDIFADQSGGVRYPAYKMRDSGGSTVWWEMSAVNAVVASYGLGVQAHASTSGGQAKGVVGAFNAGSAAASSAELLTYAQAGTQKVSHFWANSLGPRYQIQTLTSGAQISLAPDTGGTDVLVAKSTGVDVTGALSTTKTITAATGSDAARSLYIEGYPSGLETALFYRDNTDDQPAIKVRHDRATGATAATMLRFSDQSNTTVGSITANGTVTAYNTSSARHIKRNIVDADRQVSRRLVLSTRIREFEMLARPGKKQIGVIVDEVIASGFRGAVYRNQYGGAEAIDKTAWAFHSLATLQLHDEDIETMKLRLQRLEAAAVSNGWTIH